MGCGKLVRWGSWVRSESDEVGNLGKVGRW